MTPERPEEPKVMPHVFDGIQEYDQRLPNWWLFTLYGSILFAFAYWAYYFQTGSGQDDRTVLDAELSRIEAEQLAAVSSLDDATLWKLSRNAVTVAEGKAVYASLCFTCHGPALEGIKGVGFRLNDDLWVHGSSPLAIHRNIAQGVTVNGQPTGMVAQQGLGAARVTAVTAFLLSTQREGAMRTIAREQEPSQK